MIRAGRIVAINKHLGMLQPYETLYVELWSFTQDTKVTRFVLLLRRLMSNQIQAIFSTVFLELKDLLKQQLKGSWIKNREQNLKILLKSTEWKTHSGGGKLI